MEFCIRSVQIRNIYESEFMKYKMVVVMNTRSEYDEYWKISYEVPMKVVFEI